MGLILAACGVPVYHSPHAEEDSISYKHSRELAWQIILSTNPPPCSPLLSFPAEAGAPAIEDVIAFLGTADQATSASSYRFRTIWGFINERSHQLNNDDHEKIRVFQALMPTGFFIAGTWLCGSIQQITLAFGASVWMVCFATWRPTWCLPSRAACVIYDGGPPLPSPALPLPTTGTPDMPLRLPQPCGAGNGAYGSWPAGSWWLSCWNVDRGSDIRIIKANCDTRRNSRNPTQVRRSILESGLSGPIDKTPALWPPICTVCRTNHQATYRLSCDPPLATAC